MNETLLREVFEKIEEEAEADDCHWDQAVWAFQRMEDADVEEIHLDTPEYGPEDVLALTPNCGTSMCFAGWATQVGDPGSRLLVDPGCSNADRVLLSDGTVDEISSAARTLLDLTNDQASSLFDGDNGLEQLRDTLRRWGVSV